MFVRIILFVYPFTFITSLTLPRPVPGITALLAISTSQFLTVEYSVNIVRSGVICRVAPEFKI